MLTFDPELDKSAHLWTVAPCLIGGDHHIGGHEEGAILRRGHHVVSLVPDPLIKNPQTEKQGESLGLSFLIKNTSYLGSIDSATSWSKLETEYPFTFYKSP